MHFPWHLYVMAIIYILAGLNHFRKPKLYERIIPGYLPNPKFLNRVSGLAEIVFGTMLLIPKLSACGALGIILLLLLFFPVHIFMLYDQKAGFNLPKWILWLRLPLQLLLIFWAYQYI